MLILFIVNDLPPQNILMGYQLAAVNVSFKIKFIIGCTLFTGMVLATKRWNKVERDKKLEEAA